MGAVWELYQAQEGTPLPGLIGLTQAIRICTRKLEGADLSSPFGEPSAQHGIKGIKIPLICAQDCSSLALDTAQVGTAP